MIKKYFITLLLLIGLITPSIIYAPAAQAGLFDNAKQDACGGAQLKDGAVNCNSSNTTSIDTTIAKVINFLTVIIAVVAVIVIIVSGLRFVTSGGDANKVSSAKNALLYAVIGLVVVALAQVIVRYVVNTGG